MTSAVSDNKHNLLTKKDLIRHWLTWAWTCEISSSYERLQSLAFCGAMMPMLKKLYPNQEDLSSAMKRHLTFFNTEGIWGSVIPGVTAAMEEEKASGEEIDDDLIIGLKTGLMGPLAGLGDTVDWGTISPIVLGIFIPMAAKGSWVAGIAPLIIIACISTTLSYNFYMMGYRLGKKSIIQILRDGKIQKLITGASVLGLFMMGVLSSQFVKFNATISYTISGAKTTLQSQLDAILPGLVPLLIVFSIYLLMSKKKVKMTWIMLGIIVISMLLSFFQICS